MKFGSKRAIFGVIWGVFEGFGPCLGVSHPTHPHLREISQKKKQFNAGRILAQMRLETGVGDCEVQGGSDSVVGKIRSGI